MTQREPLIARLRAFVGDYAELRERRMIQDRPWLHEDLHWGRDESGEPALHGCTAGRRHRKGPVTRRGWCPCHASALALCR